MRLQTLRRGYERVLEWICIALMAALAVEVIAGVEITTEFRDKELHLLAYFVDLEHGPLNESLADIRRGREGRFLAMIERLRECGVSVDDKAISQAPDALGRRHLAQMLVDQGIVANIREAFVKYLADGGRACVAKKRLPVADAIDLVRRAQRLGYFSLPGRRIRAEEDLLLRPLLLELSIDSR